MTRLLILAVIVVVFCKMLTGRWPWEFLRGPSTRAQAVFRARKMLAVNAQASREEIIEAHKRLLALVHPDRGGSNAQVHEANAARDLLLDELPGGV
jgi:hypothetical protein